MIDFVTVFFGIVFLVVEDAAIVENAVTL